MFSVVARLTLVGLVLAACVAPGERAPSATTFTFSPAAGASAPEVASDCAAPATPTRQETEGPFFKSGSPERASLVEADMQGTRLVLTGRVLTRSCGLLARALLDFWQADGSGNYDNAGYRLRGHVLTDGQGAYRIETILPGLYTGRTRHIHVIVAAPGGRGALTTQLFFPNEAANLKDSIFVPANVMTIDETAAAWSARFDFVLDLP